MHDTHAYVRMGADYTARRPNLFFRLFMTTGDLSSEALGKFPAALVRWQKKHGRHDLPWQQTRDPYRVWLSEIMLQQTQVQTVMPYYARFLEAFPTVAALSAALQEDVLTRWAGLGYYARARNLHACARKIVAEFDGRFPDDAETLATLPGIGRSTAAAIAVFAFGKRAAILDGNVKRVFCRVFGIEGLPTTGPVDKALWLLADTLLPKKDVAAYTQGLMDLGATCCTRSKACCDVCPMASFCSAFNTDRVSELPHRKPKSALPVRTSHVWLIRDGDHVWLERRQACGIWGGLLSLPDADTVKLPANAVALPSTHVRHKFTHFELRAEVARYEVRSSPTATKRHRELEAYPLSEAEELALPTPWRKLLIAERDQAF